MIPLIIGGSSGIGLAIALKLLKAGASKMYIVAKDEPDYSAISKEDRALFDSKAIFIKHNFAIIDLTVFDGINDIDSLYITMGFGRVARFENLTETETANIMRINFEAIVMIIKRFYHLIASNKDFYTAVMVSICGRLVSPLFSVYGAAKGGMRFFIENVNCELQVKGYANRILDVSPGALKGTNFEGKGNDLSLLEHVAEDIINCTYQRKKLLIPNYEAVYKKVIDDYQKDPIGFGLKSYDYKVENGRVNNRPQVVVGYLSGTFDLFHIGHLNLLKRAKSQCDYLMVSVHESGAWKGKDTYIPYEERKAIVESIKYVDRVVEDFLEDSDAWQKYHFDKLFVGSDYKGTERFNRYERLFKGVVEIVYFPYTEGTSSTQLRNALKK